MPYFERHWHCQSLIHVYMTPLLARGKRSPLRELESTAACVNSSAVAARRACHSEPGARHTSFDGLPARTLALSMR